MRIAAAKILISRAEPPGSRSRCASSRSSHIATVWSVVRVAAVFGSSSAAWYTWSREPSRAARTVSSTTLRKVRFSAASWGGSAPTGTGLAPPAPTRQGTSTQHASGRLVISPPLRMFTCSSRSVPVSSAWMNSEASSLVGSRSSGSSEASWRCSDSSSRRFSSDRSR